MSFAGVCARFIALLAIAGCTNEATHPALVEAKLPALIQAHRFAYQGDIPGSFQLSPDGRKLAWIGPFMKRSALFVRDFDKGTVHRYRARSPNFHWTADSRKLLYANDVSGSENTHVYMIDVADAAGEAIDLTPFPGVRASIHQILPGDPDHVLVRHNRHDPRLFDLYRINLTTGKETLVAQNPGDASLPITSPDGSIRGWQKSRGALRTDRDERQARAIPRPRIRIKPDETFRVLGTSADRSFAWALSSRGRDRIALVAVHPTFGWEKVVFEDPSVDVSNVVVSRVTGAPLLASAMPGYPRYEILDPDLQADLKSLIDAQGNGQFGIDILSADAAEKRLIVSVSTSVQRRYYLVDRSSRSFSLLADAIPADFMRNLADSVPISFQSRDGLTIHGYLTLPRGVSPRRLPMVLLVHGGPWLRTGWGEPTRSENLAQAQFLANRGYAVLQVDFRGSTGYGQRFMSAGVDEFAGKMHEDLLDAVQWAIDSGTADPARVAIMGWSYGGYASLVGLTMTPDIFACGVSIAGPTDLASLIESFPPYWSSDLSMWHDYVGDPADAEDRAKMTQKSPLTHAARLRRPVLIVHGAKDVRVRIDQSERMVNALKGAGKPVEYLAMPDMGHGLSYWAHHLTVLRRTEDFLHRCIGGRSSRFDPLDVVAWVWTRVTN